MFRASKVDCVSCEEQARFVNERLTETEQKLSRLYSCFSSYAQKTSRVRDATDNIALTLNELAMQEKINRSTKNQVLIFSELLATRNDLRDNKLQQLQSKLVNHLSQYNTICRNLKEEVKTIFNIKEKETSKRKQLAKLRNSSPFNRERIVKAEAALSGEVSNISRAQRELEEHALFLEKKKLEDVKSVLQEYVLLELEEHTMAIQLLTQSFNKLEAIDINSDLRDFEEILKANPVSLRLLEVKSICFGTQNTNGNSAFHHKEPSLNEAEVISYGDNESSESSYDVSDTEKSTNQ